MTDADSAEVNDLGRTDHPAPKAPRGPRLTVRALSVLAVLLTAILVASTVVAVVKYNAVQDAEERDRTRANAKAVAEQFALRVDTVDAAKIDDYAKQVAELLTTKAKTDFTEGFDAFKQVYTEGKATGKGKVLLSGVGASDSDSATVLVVHDATVKSTFGTQVRHHRWSVDLARIDGRWLVDDFTPVN